MIDSADQLTGLLPVTRPMRLLFRSDTGEYVADLGQDLLGDWVVTQTWTGKRSRPGGGKTILVADQDAGFLLMQQIAAKRVKLGDQLT